TRCTGLDFLLEGKLRSVDASRELILCAGAIHSPRLLLLSGIGPQVDLKHLGIETLVDLPGVGRNLQDHVWIRACALRQSIRCLPRITISEVPRVSGKAGPHLPGPI